MSLLSSSGWKNAGQPQPDSYLHSEENISWPQTIHAYMPFSFSFRYSPEKGLYNRETSTNDILLTTSTYLSVAASWVTRYCIGVNFFLSSFLSTLMAGVAVFLKDQNFLLIFLSESLRVNGLTKSSNWSLDLDCFFKIGNRHSKLCDSCNTLSISD